MATASGRVGTMAIRNWTTPISSFGIDRWRVNTMRQRQETGRLHGLTSLRVFVVCRRSY
jgi:hypothetical protein